MVDFGMADAGCLLRCDYAGVVEAVRPGVHRSLPKAIEFGGREYSDSHRVDGKNAAEECVFISQRAGDPLERENGVFAELICIKADLALHIPDGMSFEEASTFGVTYLTTGRCLYQKFGLPWPDKAELDPGQLFIYGGSSAMGTMLIQFAKLSNYEVITTCSPANFELCKSYGADHMFDYRDPKAPQQILRLTNGALKMAIDCISTPQTAEFCGKVLSAGGKWSGILPTRCPREDVESVVTIGNSSLGEEWEQFGVINPASREDFEYSKGFAELTEKLIAEGKIRPHRVDVREGGLDGIPAALDDLRAKTVSGRKIVFRV